MLKKILTFVFVIAIMAINTSGIYAASNTSQVTTLRVVDIGTFNEFKYKLTDHFFTLRNDFEVGKEMKKSTLRSIYTTAKESYNYLPDDLINKNLYSKLEIAISGASQYPRNEEYYSKLIEAMDNYLERTRIQKIKGSVVATPKIGNAPLNVTLRGDVRDESGSPIPSYNYTWWIDEGGQRKVIGNKQSINYIFKEEGTFAVYLDVVSSHKNDNGYTDVLPFSSRAEITVREKIASLLIEVNGDKLGTKDELKYTPEESGYGLIFDATSSTPTGGARFTRTEWDFGNGVERINKGGPEIERIKYAKEGEYTVKLKLRTNENKTVEREFLISVHDPIATISTSKDEGYLGDKFTFGAKPSGKDDDFTYEWEIIDIVNDKQVFTKTGKTFSYVFEDKGKYNVKLKVTEPSGEVDIDTKIIYINSRAPVASFVTSTPFNNKPNTVFLDASRSYDLDGKDDGKLQYEWIINGQRTQLQDANYNGSTGYYTFDTVADHSVLLKVTDPEGITSQITKKVRINSILSVDFGIYPRVAQRLTAVRFVADSPEAVVYQWDFGNGNVQGGRNNQITHKYEKSGVYNVKLTVTDSADRTNTFSKKVYVGESNAPYAFMNVRSGGNQDVALKPGVCYGKDAYILNRADSVTFDAKESLDVTGQTSGLDYTWKLGGNKYFSTTAFTQKFDELGCFPIQLTVKSQSKGTIHRITEYIKVENLAPTLSYIDVQVVDDQSDPVVVQVTAHAPVDRDGVIQSYLWYYYTDIDPEPQDFRATKLPNTTFVLPKVTGNYYFVAMLKDDNEKRVSSEDITGSKYSITLTGDNINVPLVKLNVDDSSISVGQEVVFTTQVENILGQNLSNKAQYAWDLDGDGFYEKKTDSPNITYVYEKSGEFYAKVKASYKGYSNTKSLTMNVSNVLKPAVEYISIGNKFVLLDTSLGKVDKRTWNLGDGSDNKSEKNIIHNYQGNDGSYVLQLTLEEGVKTQTQSFRVSKNVRNIIEAKKTGLVVFSNKNIENNIITLEDQKDKLYFYVGESKAIDDKEITDFQVDIDTQYDSNINGGKDDDKDISFTLGQNNNIFEVKLNENKVQTIKISALNGSDEVVDTKTFEIQKSFIQETEIDPSNIVFTGISDSQKVTIEKIKNEIQNLPKQDRLKALMYVQKLQEEWFDAAEKTRVIVEFEGYIAGLQAANSDIIYDLLESLLLENTDDKSDQNLMFIALKNLTPTNIECALSSDDENAVCYNAIVERLEIIKVSGDLEDNKLLGKEILSAIETYPDMSVKDKKDYKAILSSFVYGGVDKMPEAEVNQEINQDKETNDEKPQRGSAITKVLMIVVWIIGIILALFLGIFGLFYLWFLIGNKDDNLGFQDFIIEKTSGKKAKITKKDDTDEILQALDGELSESIEKDAKENLDGVKKEDKTSTQQKTEEKNIDTKKSEVPDWLQSGVNKANTKNPATTQKPNQPKTEKKENGDVPDWLKTTMPEDNSTKKSSTTKNNNTQNSKNLAKESITETKIESGVPSWLKTNQESETKKSVNNKNKSNNFDNKKDITEEISDSKIEQETKLESSQGDIPDWLKGSFDAEAKSEEKTPAKESESVSKDIKTEEKTSEVSKETANKSDEPKQEKSQGDIPDWLKGSFDADTKSEEKTPTKESEPVSKDIKTEEKTSEVSKETASKSDEPKQEKSQGDIPDWLKGSFDADTKSEEKTPAKESEPVSKDTKTEEKTSEVSKETANKSDEPKQESSQGDIPDWLKGSFDADTKSEEKTPVKESEPVSKDTKTEEKTSEVSKETSNKSDEPITKDKKSEENQSQKSTAEKSKKTENKKSVKQESQTQDSQENNTEKTQKKDTKKAVVRKPKQNQKTNVKKAQDEEQVPVVGEVKEVENQDSKNIVKVVEKSDTKKVESKEEKTPAKKTTPKRKTTRKTPQKDEKDSGESQQSDDKKSQNDSSKKTTKTQDAPKKIDDELWDDGMKIPDWLQTDDDKK